MSEIYFNFVLCQSQCIDSHSWLLDIRASAFDSSACWGYIEQLWLRLVHIKPVCIWNRSWLLRNSFPYIEIRLGCKIKAEANKHHSVCLELKGKAPCYHISKDIDSDRTDDITDNDTKGSKRLEHGHPPSTGSTRRKFIDPDRPIDDAESLCKS